MRKALLLSAVLLLSTAALADDRGATRIAVMATDINYSWSENTGTRADAGVTLALSHRFGEKWGLEASYGFERGYDVSTTFHEVAPGSYVVDRKRVSFDLRPLDVVGQFFIPTGSSRWKPYVGVGAHYVRNERPDLQTTSIVVTSQVNAGSILNLTPRFGLRFDGKFLIGPSRPQWDDQVKLGVGLSVRF